MLVECLVGQALPVLLVLLVVQQVRLARVGL
jgi:hypothetical protein